MNDISFRPNIVIDHGDPYCEDDFVEMRMGACFYRNVGPCRRCKAISINAEKPEYNLDLEPNQELSKYRVHKKHGTFFGVYY